MSPAKSAPAQLLAVLGCTLEEFSWGLSAQART
jgi:hypothetical protein